MMIEEKERKGDIFDWNLLGKRPKEFKDDTTKQEEIFNTTSEILA